jgi:MoxR-like ATPase
MIEEDGVRVENLAARVRTALAGAVVGGDRISFALLVALLSRGHVLIEGVPGTGKTLAVRAFALALGVEFRRIQFTPDLMPSDVTGTTVFNPKSGEFSVRTGPLVTNVLLADEINRTPPKTQAALLEAMEESRVTIDGSPIALPVPFIVCATQNPIEYEGTYPLPEAQLDRFLVKVDATYPSESEEMLLLERVADGFDARRLEASGVLTVTNASEVLAAQLAVRRVTCSPEVRAYVYHIVEATRQNQSLSLGASPRAGVAILLAAQAAAAIDGRAFTTPDDVKDVAPFVLPHRLIVRPEAEIEGARSREIVADLLASVPVPRG